MKQTISSIADLTKIQSGLIDKVFQAELHRLTEDVIDRPGLKTSRKLMVEISIEPVVGQNGFLDSVNVSCEVNGRVPKQKTAGYSMLCRKGELSFNDVSRDNAHQRTLDEIPPRENS
jgi:hypothetical protein